jgi:hypothetical protein
LEAWISDQVQMLLHCHLRDVTTGLNDDRVLGHVFLEGQDYDVA